MIPFVGENSVILFRHLSLDEVKPGMMVVFQDHAGDNVVHMVHRITHEGLVTKGHNNFRTDPDRVTQKNLLGAVVAVLHAQSIPSETLYAGNGQRLQTAYGKSN